ncbi:hypothetical protein BO79DRAFT_214280 [Aspergillus costaricaensis CBS 115574]|uniref:Uncharacterized protein n=1 Tax=Aspergillus costaricaensis CBS 115574 TaxID=1448317 RepID=A0ACD1IQJ3_9EURO|nr:hypothetical protein BO79DRAFT_214280 [Aspergillus costaricaensis CBS 115574]RAK92866.1 hypothetical protein BO79DRAFT_214280 [Aspergillus costaricaensis CBS 115574]
MAHASGATTNNNTISNSLQREERRQKEEEEEKEKEQQKGRNSTIWDRSFQHLRRLSRDAKARTTSNAASSRRRNSPPPLSRDELDAEITRFRAIIAKNPYEELRGGFLSSYYVNFCDLLASRYRLSQSVADLYEAENILHDAIEREIPGRRFDVKYFKETSKAAWAGILRLMFNEQLIDLETLDEGILDLRLHLYEAILPEIRTTETLAMCLAARYGASGAVIDLREALGLMQDLYNGRPRLLDSPAVFMWLDMHSMLYHVFGDIQALRRGITDIKTRSSADLKSPREWTLATTLYAIYQQFKISSDRDEGISIARKVLSTSRSLSWLDRADWLQLLARLLWEQDHQSAKDEAVMWANLAVEMAAEGHPCKAKAFALVGELMIKSFERSDRIADLNEAISVLNRARNLAPPTHPSQIEITYTLGIALKTRHFATGDLEDLGTGISTAQDAIVPGGRWLPQSRLQGVLGELMWQRFLFTSNFIDLDEATRFTKNAIALLPKYHPSVFALWDQHCAMLKTEARRSGDRSAAIAAHKEVLARIPANDVHQQGLLVRLASLQLAQFDRTESLVDREAATATLTQTQIGLEGALATPKDFFSRCKLIGLCRRLYSSSFDCGEHLHYLITAKDLLENEYKSLRFLIYYRLGKLLAQLSGDLITDAIRYMERSLECAPSLHWKRPRIRYHLALLHVARYEASGMESHLSAAIDLARSAVDSMPLQHYKRPLVVHGLARLLGLRHQRTTVASDLDEAISLARDALEQSPSHSEGYCEILTGLGELASMSFERRGDLEAVRQTLVQVTETLDWLPPEYPVRIRILQTAGVLYGHIAQQTDSAADVDRGIRAFREAVQLITGEGSRRAEVLHGLGRLLMMQYQHIGREEVIGQAIDSSALAVANIPFSHPHRAVILDTHGQQYIARAKRAASETSNADFDRALQYFQEALNAPHAVLLDRVEAGQRAFHCQIQRKNWVSASRLSTAVMELLPKLVLRWLPREDQQRIIQRLTGFSSLAASAVLNAGGTPGAALHKFSDLVISSSPSTSSQSMSSKLAQHRESSQQLEKMETTIRQIPGFERFLLPAEEAELLQLALRGPIISFNVTEHRSDALILTSKGVDAIDLVNLHYADLVRNMRKLVGSNKLSSGKPSSRSRRRRELQRILHWIWEIAVQPVLSHLGYLNPGHATNSDLPRVWWLCTGYMGLAPLHAAGQPQGPSTSDFVISSYTPTIKALQHAREISRNRHLEVNPQLLMIEMPETPGKAALNTTAELAAISQTVRPLIPHPTILSNPSKRAVCEAIAAYHLVHFACHGHANPLEPAAGGLFLGPAPVHGADGQAPAELLTINELTNVSHPRAQIAYLSACSTAENASDSLIDEAIHLAGTFQLLGFPHVIGSLWEANDRAAISVAEGFYKNLVEYLLAPESKWDGDDGRIVATALHRAVGEVKQKNRDPLSWATFIHVGAYLGAFI